MKKLTAAALLLATSAAFAEPIAFTGNDFSGTYDCTGDDQHDGKFTGAITLALVPAQSTAENGSYSIKFEATGFGSYTGYAAAHGNDMALYFANTDASKKDFGNSIVMLRKNKNDKWQFESFYYEPEYFGGNYGTEFCVMR